MTTFVTQKIPDEWGGTFLDVPLEVAKIMQEVAWETVCENTYSGVNCTVSSTSNATDNAIQFYPIPASAMFTIDIPGNQSATYILSSSIGDIIQTGILNSEKIISIHRNYHQEFICL